MSTQRPTDEIKILREVLQAAAARSEMTELAIAQKAGISARAVKRFFSGKTDARLSTVGAIANSLGYAVLVAQVNIRAMQLSTPCTGKMSKHSRVGRLLGLSAED